MEPSTAIASNRTAPFDLRLAIVSHVVHHSWEGRIHAYAPYAREIEIWAGLFREIVIAAPTSVDEPPGDTRDLEAGNVTLSPVSPTGGPGIGAKLGQIARLPSLLAQLHPPLRGADAIHVRCPGNLGLLGTLMAPLYSPRRIAKYAGQWGDYPGEPRSFGLQRRLLRSRWWRGPVTVYGEWPGQPPWVVPFFSSALTESQMARARQIATHPRVGPPWNILFVGRLSAAKNVDTLLEALSGLRSRGTEFSATIIGDGPERQRLEQMAQREGLEDRVVFAGGQPLEAVLDAYAEASILVLVSQTEGWPKAITEAMAHGVVCIGAEQGLVPQILGKGRGRVVAAGEPEALLDSLADLMAAPERFREMSRRSAEWAGRFTLEHLRDELQRLIAGRWSVPVREATVHPA